MVGAAPAAAPAAANQEKTEEIVVTGSRVRRKDLTTPAPVTVISRDQITASGKVSIGDFLQSLPEQGNAINTSVNNGGDGSTRVNLRGLLSEQRTLVLINGRRMVPGGGGDTLSGSVDLNSIPAGAIERVEVLKDGASAVYGSDAVAGVVNLITRRKWNGTEITALGGVSGHGDGQTGDLSITTGTSGDRGSVVFGAGYFDQRKVMAGDRSFSEVQFGFDGTPTGDNSGLGHGGEYTIGSSRVPGGRVRATGPGNAAFTALQSSYFGGTANAAGYFIHDSSLAATNPAVAACMAADPAHSLSNCQWRPMNTSGTAGFSPGDLYNFAPLNYLLTPQKRISLWSNGDTRIGDVARGYFEASFVNRSSKQQLAEEPLIIGAGGLVKNGDLHAPVSISASNFYNPFGKDFSTASRRLTEFGPRTHDQDFDTIRAVGGLDGTLNDAFGPLRGWFWDTSFNYGRASGTTLFGGSVQSSRVANAVGPSMIDPTTGAPVCVATPGLIATKIAGCVPLDLFHGASTITQNQVDYLTFTGTKKSFNDQVAFQANTSGEILTLMSDRPVGLALGYEYRRLSGKYTNDPLTVQGDSSNGQSLDTAGSYDVNEGYAELTVPIISNRPYIQDLEASAAVRAFHYSSFGSDTTWKLGARYKPISDVTLRGTAGTAFRAPSIADLYQGQFDNFPAISDPCKDTGGDPVLTARCGAAANNGDTATQLRVTNGGNPDLKPETAHIYTLGLVFQPTFVRNLTATLDYWNLNIKNAITTVGESTILAGCYDSGIQRYCDLITRDADQFITSILNLNRNVGDETAAGIDLALRYGLPTPAYGRFQFVFDGTYLIKHNVTNDIGQLITGRNTYDLQFSSGQGGTNAPYKFNAGVLWGFKRFGAGVNTRYIAGFHECGDSFGDFSGSGLCYVDATFSRHVDHYNAYDVFVSYALQSFAGNTNVTFGVNNVFDANPPKIYNTFASATDQYTYDQIGRFFYLRLAHNY